MPGKKCPFLWHFPRHLFITIEQLPGKKGPSPPYFFRHSSTFHKKCLAKNVLFTSTLFQALPVLLNKVYQTLFSLYTKSAWQKKKCLGTRFPGSHIFHTPEEEGEKIDHLVKRVSVLLQKGLSAMLLNRIPGHPPAEVDGLL